MLRRLLRRLGAARATAALTIASIVVSVIVTALSGLVAAGEVGATGIAIAIIVPAIVAPIFTYQILRILAQLEDAETKLQALSITDPLTNAFNRRHFIELADQAFERARRLGGTFAIIIFDIDDFKQINDTYGHLAGDAVLRAVSAVCGDQSRYGDVFARYGGEEFVFLLTRIDQTHALEFAERIRSILASTQVAYHQAQIQLTVSVGVATCTSDMPDFDALLSRADTALYKAKGQGKNQTIST